MLDDTRILAPWNGLSLPGLARSMGQYRGTDVFFREWGDTRATLSRPARLLTGTDLDQQVRHFAQQMVSFGLKPGDRLGLLSLSSCDFVIGVIGAMAAGLSPVILPLSLTLEQLVALCDDAGVSGIVAGPDMDEMLLATMARTMATRSFRIRAVASFGTEAPEGVVSLAGWQESELGELPPEQAGQAPELLTADLTASAPRLFRRSQLQLIADALAFTSTAQLKPRGTVLQTMAAASGFQVASGIVAPLLVRAETRFLPLFSSSAFTDMVRAAGHQPVLVLPAHLEGYLVDAGRSFGEHPMTIAFVHQAFGTTRQAQVARFANQRIIDVTLIGEQGSYQLSRTRDGKRVPLPENWRQPGPRIVKDDALLLQARIDAEGLLSLEGYGAAEPLSRNHRIPTLRAEPRDGQTFELVPAAGLSEAA